MATECRLDLARFETLSPELDLTVGAAGHLRFAYSADALDCRATSPVADASAAPPEVRTGSPGLFTQNLDADYAYLVVYEPGP